MAILSSTTVAGSLAVSGTIYQNGTAVSLVGHTHTKAQITDFPTLATVATSGSYNDLSNKPTIPAAVTVDSAMSSTSTNPVQNKVIYTELGKKANSSSLATVATSGSYNDLSNKPTIPTVDSSLSTTSVNPVQNKVVTSALTVLDSLPSSGDYDGQIVFIKVV